MKGLLVLAALSFSGCTHYEQRVVVGAVAGASVSTLVVTNNYGHGSYYNSRPVYRSYYRPYTGYPVYVPRRVVQPRRSHYSHRRY